MWGLLELTADFRGYLWSLGRCQMGFLQAQAPPYSLAYTLSSTNKSVLGTSAGRTLTQGILWGTEWISSKVGRAVQVRPSNPGSPTLAKSPQCRARSCCCEPGPGLFKGTHLSSQPGRSTSGARGHWKGKSSGIGSHR